MLIGPNILARVKSKVLYHVFMKDPICVHVLAFLDQRNVVLIVLAHVRSKVGEDGDSTDSLLAEKYLLSL